MNADTAEDILRAGGNLVLSSRSLDVMVRLAKAAKETGTHLTFVGSASADKMLAVIHAGGKNITFDAAEYPVKE